MRRFCFDLFLGFVFCLSGVLFLLSVITHFIVHNSDPPALLAGHTIIGISALAAAIGIWRSARYASGAVLAWGLCLAGTSVAIAPGFPPEVRSGVRVAAVVVVGVSVGVICYLRRRVRD